METTVSFILLYGLLTIMFILIFIAVWRMNISENKREERYLREGRRVPTIRQDLHQLLDSKFHVSLLALPTLGIFRIYDFAYHFHDLHSVHKL